MEFDELSNRVVGCAIEVHRELGPRLLVSAYEQCLAYEFQRIEITFQFNKHQTERWHQAFRSLTIPLRVLCALREKSFCSKKRIFSRRAQRR